MPEEAGTAAPKSVNLQQPGSPAAASSGCPDPPRGRLAWLF